jgi:hypothetical protein
MTTIPQLTTNETPQFPANPPYDEGLAVLLEERDAAAWNNLLQEVSPQFGDPIAAQIAQIMKSRMAGKEVGKLIRKMLTDKAIADRIDDTHEEGPEIEYSESEYSYDEESDDEYSNRSLSTTCEESDDDDEMAKPAASSQYEERAEAEEDSEEVWSAIEGPFRYNMMIDRSLAKR